MEIEILHCNSGKSVLVDSDIYNELAKHKWFITKLGYACRRKMVNGERYMIYLHRVVANTPDDKETDHINRNKLDNRRSNLRVCNRTQNNHNKDTWGKSGYKNIYWNNLNNNWRVKICTNGKQNVYQASFNNLEDAITARNKNLKIYAGEFAGV